MAETSDGSPSFAERLEWWRRRRGLTKRRLAEGVGVNPSTITDLAAGNFNPSYDLMIRLFDFFEVSAAEFFRDPLDDGTGSARVADDGDE